jgi:hypothetical protein
MSATKSASSPAPTPLSFEKHGKLRLSENLDFTRFKSQHLVPVVFQEFYSLATEFLLVFVRHSESGDFVPVAMMGFNKDKNLYCQTPEWQPAVVPASFKLTPFALTRFDPDTMEADIAIDEDSPLLSETVGEPLFDAQGQRTDYLQKRIDRVEAAAKHSMQARALCQYLSEKRLFKNRPLMFQYSEQSPRYEIDGLFTIDEEALEKLSNEEFQELRQRGLLPIIYSHLTSLQQIGRLSRLQAQADQAAAAS